MFPSTLVALSCCLLASALDNGFPRPPLGWSALYGAPFSTVNETIVRVAAQGLVDGGFAAAGYSFVNLDDWYAERDANGTLIAIPSAWPSGMGSTSDFVHSLGLKFGVYSAASQRTCGNYSASQFLEQRDAATFANEWRIDYLKYDSCIYNNGINAPRSRYVTMRDALNKTGRKIFYSMEGNLFDASVGNAWRIGGDIWPRWDGCILRNLYAANNIASVQVPGGFSDPDMIQATGTEGAGGGLSFDEARSQFALWCAMKAPLILGANYATLATMKTDAPEYFALLTHPELIALNQDVSPQATLRASMPSAAQQGAGALVNVTLQACDPARGDQQWVAAAGGSGGVQARFGSLCLEAAEGGLIVAAPCDASNAAQSWPGLPNDSQFHVVPSPPPSNASSCLTGNVAYIGPNQNIYPSTAACTYTAPLPPPFGEDVGAQLWVWDRLGYITHGATGTCLTLGLANYNVSATGGTWISNNGTLEHDVWGGQLSTGKTVAILLNKGAANDTISATWDLFGLPAGALLPVRDVWAMADLPPATSLSALVNPHGVRVFVVG